MIKYIFNTFIVVVTFYLSACADKSIIYFDDAVVQKNNLFDKDLDGVIEAREQCDNTTVGALINNYGCGTFQIHNEPYFLDIQFDHDSYIVTSQDFVKIEKLADILKQQVNVTILIEGHSSKVGTPKYNQKLSLNRANEVAEILIERFNIAKQRISTVGYGFQKLADLSGSDNAHKINRRISIEFTYAKEVEDMKWTIYSVDEFK